MSATTFLLVHGAWHGPWCWDLLIPEIEARGHAAVAVQLPSCDPDAAALGGYQEDAEAVSAAAAAIDGHVVIVAHSYGGAVISEATFDGRVRRLVFLCAFMPDNGRSYVSYLPPGGLPPYVGLREDGTSAVPAGLGRIHFYGDCSPEVAAWAESRLRPQSQSVLDPTAGYASWRNIPSAYILCTLDQALPPDFQRMFAAQADEVIEMESSHSPMLSRPGELADILVRLAGS
ncbi:MAG: alpha/beta hydrolase [Dehalococcoidia bacterium]